MAESPSAVLGALVAGNGKAMNAVAVQAAAQRSPLESTLYPYAYAGPPAYSGPSTTGGGAPAATADSAGGATGPAAAAARDAPPTLELEHERPPFYAYPEQQAESAAAALFRKRTLLSQGGVFDPLSSALATAYEPTVVTEITTLFVATFANRPVYLQCWEVAAEDLPLHDADLVESDAPSVAAVPGSAPSKGLSRLQWETMLHGVHAVLCMFDAGDDYLGARFAHLERTMRKMAADVRVLATTAATATAVPTDRASLEVKGSTTRPNSGSYTPPGAPTLDLTGAADRPAKAEGSGGRADTDAGQSAAGGSGRIAPEVGAGIASVSNSIRALRPSSVAIANQSTNIRERPPKPGLGRKGQVPVTQKFYFGAVPAMTRTDFEKLRLLDKICALCWRKFVSFGDAQRWLEQRTLNQEAAALSNAAHPTAESYPSAASSTTAGGSSSSSSSLARPHNVTNIVANVSTREARQDGSAVPEYKSADGHAAQESSRGTFPIYLIAGRADGAAPKIAAIRGILAAAGASTGSVNSGSERSARGSISSAGGDKDGGSTKALAMSSSAKGISSRGYSMAQVSSSDAGPSHMGDGTIDSEDGPTFEFKGGWASRGGETERSLDASTDMISVSNGGMASSYAALAGKGIVLERLFPLVGLSSSLTLHEGLQALGLDSQPGHTMAKTGGFSDIDLGERKRVGSNKQRKRAKTLLMDVPVAYGLTSRDLDSFVHSAGYRQWYPTSILGDGGEASIQTLLAGLIDDCLEYWGYVNQLDIPTDASRTKPYDPVPSLYFVEACSTVSVMNTNTGR
jgi:hypothetical protein